MKKLKITITIAIAFAMALALTGCIDQLAQPTVNMDQIPEYSGKPFVYIDDNVPSFEEEYMTQQSFEKYSSLDYLGRCGVAFANVGKDLMPTEERGSIGMVKPSGWQIAKYDSVDGKYLYNRCHLIGFQLTGENANERNLITGTRYMNVEGMLSFENEIADYVKSTGNHVLYRVTPIFEGMNLLATGVHMEAYSVEDQGRGVCFNVFCYNVQPHIIIDYATGENQSDGTVDQLPVGGKTQVDEEEGQKNQKQKYVLNTNTMKFHYPTCKSAEETKAHNKDEVKAKRTELLKQGYEPCKRCNP